jgi:hypothetical protein
MLLPEQALLIGFALVGLFGGRRRKLAALLIGWLVPCGAACRAVGAGAWNPGPSGAFAHSFFPREAGTKKRTKNCTGTRSVSSQNRTSVSGIGSMNGDAFRDGRFFVSDLSFRLSNREATSPKYRSWPSTCSPISTAPKSCAHPPATK